MVNLKKIGKVYYALGHHNGKYIKKSLKTTTKALASKRYLAFLNSHGVDSSVDPSEVYFSQLVKNYVGSQTLKPKTRSKYRCVQAHFIREFGDITINKINIRTAELFKESLKPKSTFTIRSYCQHFKALLNYAAYLEYFPQSPVKQFSMPRPDKKGREHFFSLEDIDKIKNTGFYETQFILFLLNTGLRLSEWYNLQWSDYDKERQQLYIKPIKRSKGRYVPLNNTAHNIISRQNRTSTRIFLRQDGKPFTHHFLRTVKRIYASVGLTGNVHTLRHTCFSHMARLGVSLRTIQEIGGWSSLDVMEIYLHMSPSQKHEAISLLPF